MAGRDEEARARCEVQRPPFMRETDPGMSGGSFKSIPIVAEPDPRVAAHNLELLARLDGRARRPAKSAGLDSSVRPGEKTG